MSTLDLTGDRPPDALTYAQLHLARIDARSIAARARKAQEGIEMTDDGIGLGKLAQAAESYAHWCEVVGRRLSGEVSGGGRLD